MPDYVFILFLLAFALICNGIHWTIKNMIKTHQKEQALERDLEHWLEQGEQHGN